MQYFSVNADNPKSLDETRKLVNNIVKFLKLYKLLIDAYVSDFYEKNLWEKIPEKWWQCLVSLPPDQLACLLSSRALLKSHEPWPLGLLAHRVLTLTWCLPRTPCQVRCDILEGLKKDTTSQSNKTDDSAANILKAEVKDGQCRFLEHCYRKHVKPKKQHEIQCLAECVHNLASSCQADRVIDVGAGLGHLSRLLSFGYGHKVVTIEATDGHAPKASSFDSEVKKDIKREQFGKKKKQEISSSPLLTESEEPLHVTAWIDSSISVNDFIQQVMRCCDKSVPQAPSSSEIISQSNETCQSSKRDTKSTETVMALEVEDCDSVAQHKISNNSNDELKTTCKHFHELSVETNDENCDKCKPLTTNSSVTECHQCGKETDKELSGNLVMNQDSNQGSSNTNCEKLVLTGLHACGDLTPTMLRVFVNSPELVGLASVACCYMKMSTNVEQPSCGYPMSSFVQGLAGHELSYEAREMACHFADSYSNRLQENSSQLRSHSYRTALQEIINTKCPDLQHGCIKLTAKKAHEKSFTQYAEYALKRLGLDPSLTSEQVQKAEDLIANHWLHVAAFYTLRLSVAPIVETLILLDRALYLAEQGLSSLLVPLFDPELSPRNHVLLAMKS